MFDNRQQAGELLARALKKLDIEDPAIYALPRGGLPVAAAIAKHLSAPLDIILVRKLGAPGHAELAIGAVVDGPAPTLVLHRDIIHELNISQKYLDDIRATALREIERRRALYIGDNQPLKPEGRNVIIVDDGLATGATMETAVKAMRRAGAKNILVAVPTGPKETVSKLRKYADDVVCLDMPLQFWSVGNQYRSFPQLSDKEVIETLQG
ncbi:phosphoribosyltransferase [Hyphococcus sp. DH-69]|uniref:phosphoribosyltransferase n=1 Tax=Hyphococcus formosus TaxID=3143534 RepID=UPI00398BB1D3